MPKITKKTTLCTSICRKLLLICYYYSRFFGTVSYCISNRQNGNTKQNSTCGGQTPPCIALHAYEQNYLMWFTVGQRMLCGVIFYYGSFILWKSEDAYFNSLTILHATLIFFCSISFAITQIWYRERTVNAINNLFQLIHSIRQLHPNYQMFQWSHALLLTVKLLCFMYEIGCIVDGVLQQTTLLDAVLIVGNIYLMIGVWLNLHIACILYICIEAIYGTFNNYMSSTFLHKLRGAQTFAHISVSPLKVKQLIVELEQSLQLYQEIYRVGQELHYTLQVPVVNTILFTYTGMISIVYFMIWRYFESDLILWYYVPFMLKLAVDIVLLSLTAHKAIKSSHIIRRIGLENIILSENEEWHRHMELFLYHINLNDFKLNILGLFDITNTLTLTFISGILTSLTIFIPFSIKSFRMKEILTSN